MFKERDEFQSTTTATIQADADKGILAA